MTGHWLPSVFPGWFFVTELTIVNLSGTKLKNGLKKTWSELKKVFLYKFFPPMRTSKFRNEISGFQQHELESPYEAWQRYKALQRQCPHHGIPEWLLIQTFYNGLKHEVRISIIDAASGGTFMAKTPKAAKTLLDDMAANNYLNDWSVSRGAPKKGAKVDQLSSGPVAPVCEICEVQGHSFNECQYNTMGAVTEQANALLSTNTRPQNNPNSNTYNPVWKNHPNFSYKNNQPQPPPTNYSQLPGFQQRPPFNSSSSSSTSNLETIIENLASSQAKQIEYHAKQNDFFSNSLQQIHAHNIMMENQMTQLVQQISHLSKPSGQLPGQT
ncbi:uncharacterized protein LOC130591846 [Beta vulgaris subsp. vulgaris]|uniref:uncharacterized protein LOC130591846 n=1 Tax=Beta vulgaris subsp. vulgaris TaxID=3555 RepID=UPI0025491CC3|nr:uncharacterized protein LOC130591846 [Beta vulgaris subsp. vulgaris]